MSLKIACPQCQKNFKVTENLAGKKVNCPSCKTVVPVPAAADELSLQPSGAAPAEDDLKLYVPGEEPGAKTEVQTCPACGHDVPIDGVLCVHCGYNFKTKQSVRGHQIKTPGRGKLYVGTMISGLFFFLLVCAGGYAIYYAFFKADITKRFREMGNPEAKKDESGSSGSGSSAPAAQPAAPTQSLLVVTNERFPRITIFKDGGKIGQADLGKTEKIPVTPGDAKTPVKISFEVRTEDLARGTQLNPPVRDALSKGLNFEGTVTDGMRLIFAGPPADLLPKNNEVLQGIPTVIGEFDKASGTGKFKAITYKGNTIKAADEKNPLRLGWKPLSGNKVELTWLDQDCIVEKEGKTLYQPPASPFKPEIVKLAQKDGKVDLAP